MMSIDLSDLTPPPRRRDAKPLRREAPCAGLFGWRKDAAPPGVSDDKPATPGADYPAG